MSLLQAIILGILQGLTEFLPVSSSGHLVLLQTIFNINEGTAFFNVMVHLGTLLAVIWILRQDLLAILKRPFGKTTWLLIIATVPIVIFAVLLGDFIDVAMTGRFLGFAFILTGIILTLSETAFSSYASAKSKKSNVNFPGALTMGLMQAIAVLPGVSRSGSTIAGGLFCGLDRKLAARFAFLMSVPAILGSVVLEASDAIKTGFAGIDWLPILVGMGCALLSGLFAVKIMLNLIAKKKLYGFAIYTLALGVLVLLDQFLLHIFFAPII